MGHDVFGQTLLIRPMQGAAIGAINMPSGFLLTYRDGCACLVLPDEYRSEPNGPCQYPHRSGVDASYNLSIRIFYLYLYIYIFIYLYILLFFFFFFLQGYDLIYCTLIFVCFSSILICEESFSSTQVTDIFVAAPMQAQPGERHGGMVEKLAWPPESSPAESSSSRCWQQRKLTNEQPTSTAIEMRPAWLA